MSRMWFHYLEQVSGREMRCFEQKRKSATFCLVLMTWFTMSEKSERNYSSNRIKTHVCAFDVGININRKHWPSNSESHQGVNERIRTRLFRFSPCLALTVNRLNISADEQLVNHQGKIYALIYIIEFDSSSRSVLNVYLHQGQLKDEWNRSELMVSSLFFRCRQRISSCRWNWSDCSSNNVWQRWWKIFNPLAQSIFLRLQSFN